MTLYGRVDLGYASSKDTLKVGADSTSTKTSSFAGDQNGRTTSRLGVTGTEDLGGGLKANFNYEVGLAPDDTGRTTSADTRSGFGTTRLANLGVSGGFGTVVIGTYLNALDVVRGYSAATFSAAGGDFLANHAGNQRFNAALGLTALDPTDERFTLGLSGRSTNSIAYVSPNMGGFTFGVGTVQEKAKSDALTGDFATESSTKGVMLSAAYAAGPLKVNVAHGTAKLRSNLAAAGTSTSPFDNSGNTNERKVSDTGVAASYDMGVAVPYVQYERIKHDVLLQDGVAGNDGVKTSAFEIGSKFPMGALTPFVTVGSGKITYQGEDALKTSSFQIGTTYDLSKRTYLHAAVGQFKIKDSEDASFKRTGFKAGLVHSF